jgi:L-iditol 2-dehydrogenase
VLVRVEACGICGSDVHGYDGSSGRRIPPIVMGHEAAGTVAAIGAGVTGYAVGDRVTFDSTVYCGACAWCQRGDVNLCDNRQVIGVSCGDYRRHGAFAEYVAVPQRILYRLPRIFPSRKRRCSKPTSVALHAVRVSQAKGGETALVIGAGMIGLLTLQAARAGMRARVCRGRRRTRLQLAKEVGRGRIFACSGAELAAEVLQLTEGRGVDLALKPWAAMKP